jgi:hypothetical protein
MRYEILVNRNGSKQAIEVIAGTYKKWKVWNVRLNSGEEAVLFKCGRVWLQGYNDKLEYSLLSAIGERVDHICLGLALS